MSTHGNMPLDDDIRIIGRNIAKGFLAAEAAEKALKDLPDSESLGEYWDPSAEPVAEEEVEDSASEDA